MNDKPNAIPRPEYPRPIFRRDDWQNLNGRWAFQFDPADVGRDRGWEQPDSTAISGAIMVPFPWQSQLSGIADLSYQGIGWYRRAFGVSPSWAGRRVWLHFGAVDHQAEVWVNGCAVGQHEGGYLPFAFDITDALIDGDNTLTVRVYDPADLGLIPHGKQTSAPRSSWWDCSFTTTSGIWQTVWIEAQPMAYIVSAKITPDIDAHSARFDLEIAGEAASLEIEVTAPNGEIFTHNLLSDQEKFSTSLPIPTPILWDVRAPNLYQVTLKLRGTDGQIDTVYTYFGMRKIAVNGNRVLLNNRPLYLMSALDQGYWSDGLFAPPSDDAIRADVEYALRIGLNGLRKHIKIEDPRFAYWADKLGLLLWCDMPSPEFFHETAHLNLSDGLRGMIERDYNHPSIVVWTPYNESWGLEFRSDAVIREYLTALYHKVKSWDSTRLVVDNSGWQHAKTDLADSHKYAYTAAEWETTLATLENAPDSLIVLGHEFYVEGARYSGEPLLMSEFGVGTEEVRGAFFKAQTNALRRHGNIVGYTYTELYDIEHELAGFARYDRTPKDFGYDIAMINSEDFIGFLDDHDPPIMLTAPGAPITVRLFVSAFGHTPIDRARVFWRLDDGDDTSFACDIVQYHVTPVGDIVLPATAITGRHRLNIALYDAAGARRAANFLDFDVTDNS